MRKIIYSSIYLLSPLGPILALYLSNPAKYQGSTLLYSMILGCLAYTFFTWQFVLSARPKFLDRVFGMDKIYRFHGMIAVGSLIMIFIHQSINEGLFSETLQTTIGSLTFYIFLGISVLSVLFMVNSFVTKIQPFKWIRQHVDKLNTFKYEHYRALHNLTILALLTMQLHVLMTSSVRRSVPVFIVFTLYFITGCSFYLYHKFIKPWYLRDKTFIISAITPENQNMWSIHMKPKFGHVFSYQPGQFGFFTIFSSSIKEEEHPFSFSSSPTNHDEIIITVKKLGDFTSTIDQIAIGDEVLIDGPYGRFSYQYHEHEDELVFIVGGIGITPAISMLRHIRDLSKNKKVLLLWGMNTESDYILSAELHQLTKRLPDVTIIPVVAFDDQYTGEKGFIDLEKIERIIADYKINQQQAGFYLCGPPILMDQSITNLKHLGVKRQHIHYEKFSL